MEARKFGARLRELRIQAGFTQRELADNVNIDFTYLSKIENGVLPPPSEKVILRLAEVLNADKDEFITLAGRIPADIAQILKNRKALQLLRSERTQKKIRASSEKGAAVPKSPIPLKNFARVAIAVILVIAIGAAFWFIAPTTADTAIAANNEGIAYNNNEEYNKAIVAFSKAIELDPNFALAYNNRGWSYIELGQYEQAIAE